MRNFKRQIQWLQPKKSRGKPKPFAVFDIETYGRKAGELFGKFALAFVYFRKGEQEILKHFTTLESLTEYLLSPACPDVIFAHNLKFEGKFLLSELDRKELLHSMVEYQTSNGSKLKKPMVELVENHGRWLQFSVRKPSHPERKRLFRDSMNYFAMSLEEAISKFKLEYQKIEVNFDECYPESLEMLKLKKHCINDVKATYELVKQFNDYCEKLGIKPQLTIASTAMELFKCKALDWKIPLLPKQFAEFVRQGYYGGRTEVFQQLHEGETYIYDANSLYPSQYRQPLPCGFPYWADLQGRDISKLDELGFIQAIVDIPRQGIPPLPYRAKDGKLIFPYGRITGVWFSEELKEAVNHYGVKVIAIKRAILWLDSLKMLNKYADLTESLKIEAQSLGELGIAKLLRNALYGKFGEHPRRSVVHFEPVPDSRFDSGEQVNMTNEEGVDYWLEEVEVRKGYHLPQIASAITSYARIAMLRSFRQIQALGNRIFYCDTDSIVTDKPIPDEFIGKRDGLFKLEAKGSPFIALAPKVYYLGNDEKPRVKIKGFPPSDNGEAEFRRALAGEHDALRVEWLSPEFDSEAVAYKLMPRGRSLRALDDKREHITQYDSIPLKVVEYE